MSIRNTPRTLLAALPLILPLAACGGGGDELNGFPSPPRLDTSLHTDPLIKEAVEAATAAVLKNPGTVKPRIELGKFFAASDLHSQARTAFEQALEVGAKDAHTLSYLAFECHFLGDVESALTHIRSAQAVRDDYAPLFWREGSWLLENGQPEEAKVAFLTATKANAQDPYGWMGLARSLLQTGQAEAALEALETVRSFATGRVLRHASHLTGTALARLGRTEEAAPYFDVGQPMDLGRVDRWRKELRPYSVGFSGRMTAARRALRAGRRDEAIGVLEPLLEHHSSTRGLIDNLASCYFADLRFEKVVALLEKYKDESAPSANSYYLESQARSVLGAESGVVQALLERSLEAGPGFLPTLVRMADQAIAAKEYEVALEHYEVIAETTGPTAEMMTMGGRCAVQLKRWDRAVALFEKALRLSPGDAPIIAALERARRQLEAGK